MNFLLMITPQVESSLWNSLSGQIVTLLKNFHPNPHDLTFSRLVNNSLSCAVTSVLVFFLHGTKL